MAISGYCHIMFAFLHNLTSTSGFTTVSMCDLVVILKKYNLQWQILNRKLGQVEQYKCCNFYPWTISGLQIRVQWR
jgi:hypothetical protein